MSEGQTPAHWFKPGNQLAKGNEGGRPEVWTQEQLMKESQALEEWIQNPNSYYLGEFCVSRGYTLNQIDEIAGKSKVFSETLKKARQMQENRIVQNSLTRKFDGNFAKFVLANRAGWKEKTEVSGDANNPLSFLLSSLDGKSKDIPIDVTPDEPKQLSEGND